MDSSPPLRPPPIWVADSLFGFSDTSSSGISTPFGSLDSTRTETESDDEEDYGDGVNDFLSELTRQVAGFTLDDDEEEDDPSFHVLQDRPAEPREAVEPPSRKKQGSPAPGRRRAERGDSTQKRAERGAEQKKGKRRGGGGGRSQALKSGSGMQAVFLGGSGYATGGASSSSGTGVFLPRGISNHRGPTESKRKSGCSTVLIPTRVLQVLQLHHSNNNKSQSNACAAPHLLPSNERYSGTKRDQVSGVQTRPEMEEPEMPQLPQEWTY